MVIVNVGNEPARVKMIARKDDNAQSFWSKTHSPLEPFKWWNPDMEDIKVKCSVEVNSDQPIVAERHMHDGTAICRFAGGIEGRRTHWGYVSFSLKLLPVRGIGSAFSTSARQTRL